MPAPRPNILWIVTTQWRGQACGFAGDLNARTPHLDAFARNSVVFEQAFSNHPFGPFARALLLSGRPCPDNGVRDYWDPLPRDTCTVAHHLGAVGYRTAFFGKWHLAPRDRTAPVVGEVHARQLVSLEDRGGFDHWEGFEGGFLLNDPWLHGTTLPKPTQFPGYQSDVLCTRAAAWIAPHTPAITEPSGIPQSAIRNPYFTVVSLESPHPPYAAATPPDIPTREPAALQLAPNVPRGGEVEATVRSELAGYYRHIEATDRAIGRLLATVDPATTAVVVTSVHGDMHGAHGLFRKGWPHEESIRVPLLARWPGNTPQRIHTPVSLADLPATALALAGAAVPDGWVGADLRRIVPDAERTIQLAMPSAPPFAKQCPHSWHGIRTRDELRVFTTDGHPWLHFNLRLDPDEKQNLCSDASNKKPGLD